MGKKIRIGLCLGRTYMDTIRREEMRRKGFSPMYIDMNFYKTYGNMEDMEKMKEAAKGLKLHLERSGAIADGKTWYEILDEWQKNDVGRFEYIIRCLRENYADDRAESGLTTAEIIEKVNNGMALFEEQAKIYKDLRDVHASSVAIRYNLLVNIAATAMVNIVKMDKAADEAAAFCALTEQMFETFKRKNHDYGNSFDKSLDKFGLVAAACRMGDKMNRIVSLTKDEAMVKDESVRDTLLDLANYAVMTVMWVDKIVGNTFA